MKSLFGGPVRGHVQVELLSAYLDGQASPAERASIDAHLQQCVACQAELESLRRTVTLLQALPRVAVPRAFTLSEAQVGVRRPDPSPGWFGGLARGLGAVAAVLVVALVAFAVLRPERAPWNPDQTVARVSEPTAAVAVMQTADQAAESGPAAAPAPLAMEAPTAATEAPAAAAAAPEAATLAAAPTPEPEPQLAAAAAPPTEAVADAAATAAPQPTATQEPVMVAKAAATPEPEMGAAAMGLGGGGEGGRGGMGGGGAGGPGIPAEQLTPEPTPPGQPLATALPIGLRFAYADLNSLWAVDRDGGARQVAQGRGINTPQLSPDQQWIAYRMYTDTGLQLWAVRFEGGAPKLLLDDAKLPTDRLPEGYTRRAFSDSRWGPGNVLVVTLTLVPDPEKPLPPVLELWQVNVESGNLKFLNELGRAWRPFYSPGGEQFLTVATGAEELPDGEIALHETGGGKATTLLTFPAGPGKLTYDSQVSWIDGSSAWVAVPVADNGQPVPPNGTEIYRLDGEQLAKIADVDAFMVYWSPGGDQMAYTRFISESMATNELYLAAADGSNPELYATMTDGQFISWSPSGKRFLYQDNYQVFLGEQGKEPVRLANGVSMVGPRWISDEQIMSFHDTGDGWLLTLRDVNGDAAGLLPLPRDAMWDVVAGS